MYDDMQQEAVDVASTALSKFGSFISISKFETFDSWLFIFAGIEKDVAAYIKKDSTRSITLHGTVLLAVTSAPLWLMKRSTLSISIWVK